MRSEHFLNAVEHFLKPVGNRTQVMQGSLVLLHTCHCMAAMSFKQSFFQATMSQSSSSAVRPRCRSSHIIADIKSILSQLQDDSDTESADVNHGSKSEAFSSSTLLAVLSAEQPDNSVATNVKAEHSRFCRGTCDIQKCKLFNVLKSVDSYYTFQSFFQQLGAHDRILLSSVAGGLRSDTATQETLEIAILFRSWSWLQVILDEEDVARGNPPIYVNSAAKQASPKWDTCANSLVQRIPQKTAIQLLLAMPDRPLFLYIRFVGAHDFEDFWPCSHCNPYWDKWSCRSCHGVYKKVYGLHPWTPKKHWGFCSQSCGCCRTKKNGGGCMECDDLLMLKNTSRHMRHLLRSYYGR